jgi:hypothetical protein
VLTVFAVIANREDGLRDFTIVDPDRVGLRFGTRLVQAACGLAPANAQHLLKTMKLWFSPTM